MTRARAPFVRVSCEGASPNCDGLQIRLYHVTQPGKPLTELNLCLACWWYLRDGGSIIKEVR